MIKILERAIQQVKRLPSDRQDELGEMILSVVEQDESEVSLSPDQMEEVRRRMAAPKDLASEAEAKAFFRNLPN